MDSAIQLFNNWGLDYIFTKHFISEDQEWPTDDKKRTERRMKSTKYAIEYGSTFGVS